MMTILAITIFGWRNCVYGQVKCATQHMTYSKEYTKNYKKIAPANVHLADDVVVQVIGTGDIVMSMTTQRRIKKEYVNIFTFERDRCFAEAKGLRWKLGAREGNGLFKLGMNPMHVDEVNMISLSTRHGDTTSYLWHLRLGRIGHGGLSIIVTKDYGTGINSTSTPALGEKRYYAKFIDEKSHYCVVYSLRNKFVKFANFVALAKNKTNKRVKTLQCDNAGEYTSGEMTKFCAERGIVQKFTPPYTPQLNGAAELGLGEAVTTAMFHQNCCPTRAVNNGMSPYKDRTGKKPVLMNLRVFDCHAFVQVPKEKRSEFDARSVCCRFLGYLDHEYAYRLEEIEGGRVLVSRDVHLTEDVFDSGRCKYSSKEVVIEHEEVEDQDSTQPDDTGNEYEEFVKNQHFKSIPHQQTHYTGYGF
ncbi:gag-pol polyprotein [Plasmopara halstedii]|uniref:Gag-pol polyprotein n=1 Tax=Plasmopara halstedii TaxID=4781 RepID=A0A0P1AG74_PLAHL|nr:gag-pol polyprotein [Plasmopara halstedii]CEG39615.1 gag-pol polyprotein [Plasmopara halstedii]|eukprot:XP_024575984.1 gag-pol polyprotein [Plasmopara halstedii]